MHVDNACVVVTGGQTNATEYSIFSQVSLLEKSARIPVLTVSDFKFIFCLTSPSYTKPVRVFKFSPYRAQGCNAVLVLNCELQLPSSKYSAPASVWLRCLYAFKIWILRVNSGDPATRKWFRPNFITIHLEQKTKSDIFSRLRTAPAPQPCLKVFDCL